MPLCSNIVDFVGAGEVRAGDVPGAFACEFIVQVRSILAEVARLTMFDYV